MIKFPSDVRGWLTEAEGFALAAFAFGKTVLEIGSYCGRSTICMAQTARKVVAVDPFDGRGTPEPGDTAAEFVANVGRYGVGDKVVPVVGTIDRQGPDLPPAFDLVFIDGAHDYASVHNDIEWALRLMKPGGLIAFHDYLRRVHGTNLGVDRAVGDLLEDGGELLCHVDTLALVRPPRELVEGADCRRKVVLAMPHNGTAHAAAAESFFRRPTLRPREVDVAHLHMASSVLTLNFNRLWCEALNLRAAGFTHFVMLHDDVVPEPGFVDVLLGEIDRLGADVVSCVVPIKSAHGLTSTALGHDGRSGSVWRPLRRLTMAEVHDLPETFCRADVPLDGPPALFVNTGCWVADLRKPWVEKNVFRNEERVVSEFPDGTGRRKADCLSEDWAFSCDLSRWGARVYATRKVPLYHEHVAFHNRGPWGMWKTDEEYLDRTRAGRACAGTPAGATLAVSPQPQPEPV